jgi:O-antigen/teichoic acid export membrane protein
VSGSLHDEPSETPVSSLAKHSLVYSLAPLIQRFLALGLNRVWTNKLDPARMGVANTLDLLFIALIQISGTNVLAGVVRFYFDQKDERDRNAVVSSAVLFLAAVSWTLVGLCLVFREALTEFFFNAADPALMQDNLVHCLVVTLLTIPLALSSDAAFRYLQIQQKSGLISTLRVSKACLEMALKVVFLVVFEWGVVGFLLATLVGELVTNLLLTAWVLRRTGLRFSWRVLRPMLVYAAPLVAVGLCQMGLNQIDRFMLGQLGPEVGAQSWVGVYSQGYLIGFLVQTVVVGSFMQIWQPWIFGVRDEARRSGIDGRELGVFNRLLNYS